jgi:hypothetical protein
MMYRRAAVESGKRAGLVLIAAAIVVLIGLVVFSHREGLPRWVWDRQADQAIERLLR